MPTRLRSLLSNGQRNKHYSIDGVLLCYHAERRLCRLYVPALLRAEALIKIHGHVLAGSSCAKAAVEKAGRSFWWRKMPPSEEPLHLTSPTSLPPTKWSAPTPGLLASLSTPRLFCKDILRYFTVDSPPVIGRQSIYGFVDRPSKPSKYAHLTPTSGSSTARSVAQTITSKVWMLHDFENGVITDSGLNFVCASWRELMKELNMRHNKTPHNAHRQTVKLNSPAAHLCSNCNSTPRKIERTVLIFFSSVEWFIIQHIGKDRQARGSSKRRSAVTISPTNSDYLVFHPTWSLF